MGVQQLCKAIGQFGNGRVKPKIFYNDRAPLIALGPFGDKITEALRISLPVVDNERGYVSSEDTPRHFFGDRKSDPLSDLVKPSNRSTQQVTTTSGETRAVKYV